MNAEDLVVRITALEESVAYARTLVDMLTAQSEALVDENKRLKAKLAEMGVPDNTTLN